MIKKQLISFLILSIFTCIAYAQPRLSKSDMIKINFKVLAANKTKLNDPALKPAYKQLLKDAEKALKFVPVSVIEKTALPPSGDKHDFMSIAPYWWPDPSKPDGVPYMRKDGEINPEVRNYPDKENLPKLFVNVNLLSLAYYYSGDERYAEHAAKLMRVWFLDKETRMNPNLNFAQAVKGRNDGRAEGVLDTRYFLFLLDDIKLISKSTHWSKDDQLALKSWFKEFLNWMQTSELGIDEMNAKNNHGVWYDAQALGIAFYIDSLDLAKKIMLRAGDRLEKQMDANGFFPLELERTTSLHYSVFIMNAFAIIASLSENAGTDLWMMNKKSGQTLEKAFNAVLPYIKKQKEWTAGKQIKEFNFQDSFPLLLTAANKLHCSDCLESIKKTAGEEYGNLLINLL